MIHLVKKVSRIFRSFALFLLTLWVFLGLRKPSRNVIKSQITFETYFCKNLELFKDYIIYKNETDNNYISVDGFSGKNFECPYLATSNFNKLTEFKYNEREIRMNLFNGGLHIPRHCTPKTKVAIIVPYRNRPEQLAIFLQKIHEYLQFQNIYYRIFIIEQNDYHMFNRGFLLNVGVAEARKLDGFNCFVFHDVDRIPKFALNRYDCPSSPRHLSVQDNDAYFTPTYRFFAGAVTSVTYDEISDVNGFSNIYWGWGGEDDDFYMRLTSKHHFMKRVNLCLGQYSFLKEGHRAEYSYDYTRHILIYSTLMRIKYDGLKQIEYTVKSIHSTILSTHITVHLKKRRNVRDCHIIFCLLPPLFSYLLFLLTLSFIQDIYRITIVIYYSAIELFIILTAYGIDMIKKRKILERFHLS